MIAGTAQEIVDRLKELNASPGHVRDTCGFVNTITPYNPEIYKVLVLDMLREAGVKLLLHSFVDDVQVKGDRIESVRLTSKSGKIDVRAKMFIDTSGDADAAYLAGAPILQGRDQDQLTQPMTMKFRMRGVDLAKVKQYMLDHPDEFYKKTPISELQELPLTAVQGFYKHWKDACLPINRDQVLFFPGPGEDEVLVNTTRVQGLDGTRVEDLTEAEELGRKQVLMVADFMVKRLPGFEKASISQVGAQIGIRETRRLDASTACKSPTSPRDAASRTASRGAVPDRYPRPEEQRRDRRLDLGDGAYDIPYRCLLAKGISNLLAGGRCISTTHEALATTRLTPSCMATGQAAGTAAGMAVQTGITPHEVNVSDLQRQLRLDGALLD